MPDLVYIANKSAYTITELTVLGVSESQKYYTYNSKTGKYQWWDKSKCHLSKNMAIHEIDLFHSLKISELENSIKAAQKKLETFKEKYKDA